MSTLPTSPTFDQSADGRVSNATAPEGFTPDLDDDGAYICHEGPDHQAGPVRVMRSWTPERGLCLWLDHPGKTGPSPVADLAELRDYLNAVIPSTSASDVRRGDKQTITVPITWTSDTSPDGDFIHASIAPSELLIGYRIDFEGYENNEEGFQPFAIDLQHLDDFIALLQRVKDSL